MRFLSAMSQSVVLEVPSASRKVGSQSMRETIGHDEERGHAKRLRKERGKRRCVWEVFLMWRMLIDMGVPRMDVVMPRAELHGDASLAVIVQNTPLVKQRSARWNAGPDETDVVVQASEADSPSRRSLRPQVSPTPRRELRSGNHVPNAIKVLPWFVSVCG
jgi:hypothetical protein